MIREDIKESLINYLRPKIKSLFRLLILIYLALIVLKLCGYHMPLVVENENWLRFSDYVDSNKFVYYLIEFITYTINSILIYFCTTNTKFFKKKKHFIIFMIITMSFFLLNIFIPTIYNLIIIPCYIIIPLIFTKDKYRYIFIYLLIDLFFMSASLFIRGYDIDYQEKFIIELVLQIDYYIAIITYYIGGVLMNFGTVLPIFMKKENLISTQIDNVKKRITKLQANISLTTNEKVKNKYRMKIDKSKLELKKLEAKLEEELLKDNDL